MPAATASMAADRCASVMVPDAPPVEPVGPVAPVEPVGPVAPVDPVAPVAPVGPLTPLVPPPVPVEEDPFEPPESPLPHAASRRRAVKDARSAVGRAILESPGRRWRAARHRDPARRTLSGSRVPAGTWASATGAPAAN